jgi:hypothetical protein
MRPMQGQSPEVFELHKRSVEAHFNILKSMTSTIAPEDTTYLDHFQTPLILEILYELDPSFRASVEKFAEAIDKSGDILVREFTRLYGGFYGPTVVSDFTSTPGTSSTILRLILERADIPPDHKMTILAGRSFGINTGYLYGTKIIDAIETGRNIAEGVEDEKEAIKSTWLEPLETELKLLDDAGFKSFDPKRYADEYVKEMRSVVEAAVRTGVHYANIVTIPMYGVADIGNHISPMMFKMMKDDMAMAILEAVSKVVENTLRRGLKEGKFKDAKHILKVAAGAFAAATTHILELDHFTVDMIIDLFYEWFHNYVQRNPYHLKTNETHIVDFLNLLALGEKILEKPPLGRGGMVDGVRVDLSPIDESEAIMKPGEQTFYHLANTQRFASLMKFADFPCLITSEPLSATILTNIAALNKGKPIAPMKLCKSCAISRYVKRHDYCLAQQNV